MEANKDIKIRTIKETKAHSLHDTKSTIPWLHPEAIERSTDDKNLAPFLSNPSKTFQYGNSRLSSINTDHPDWAPGECLNLHKYEGRFRIKLSRLEQQVNGKNY